MCDDPANDDKDFSDYVTFELDGSFSELIDALRANGTDVEVGLLDTDAGTFKPVAND